MTTPYPLVPWVDAPSATTPINAAALKNIPTYLDARMWGVVGDGATDNYSALSALQTSMLSTGPGATAVLPPGVILTSGPMVTGGNTGFLGCYWMGHGPNATIVRKTGNFDLVQFTGSGTGFATHARSQGLSHLTLDGNGSAYTGRLLDCAYGDLIKIDNVKFQANADIGIDTTETWDSTFSRVFLENVGTSSAPSVWIRSSRAASGFGASTDTTNVLRFNMFHAEAFQYGAIRIEPGTSGAAPNKLYFSQFKLESVAIMGPPIYVNNGQEVYFGQGNVQMDSLNTGFSTPQPAIYWVPNNGSALRDVFIGVSAGSVCEEGVWCWTGSQGMIDNVYGGYAGAPTTGKHINLPGGGPYNVTNCHASGATYEVYTASGVELVSPNPARPYLQQSANYAVTNNDEHIGVVTSTTAITITLPAISAALPGKVYEIKDETGGAATHNVTVARSGSDTIDGATSKVINTAYGMVRVMATPTGWSVI